jgi:hypothetical protein
LLPDDLLRPEAWPSPRPTQVELVETHVSWVLLGEREVLKIKKPVNLGFVDFRSLDRRAAACRDEVTLNRRLAKSVYLGVLPIARDAQGRLTVGGEGPVVEWAVHMQRLDDARRGDVLLARRTLTLDQLDVVARAVADLHRGAAVEEPVATRCASPSALDQNVRENFAQTAPFASASIDASSVAEVERAQTQFVVDHRRAIEARVAAGRVRDGHGDLRLEHLYFEDDGLQIIDCIEFDERYRVGDVAADVAFLSMDLAARGHVDLAEWFLARYARASGDYDLYELVDFYEGYRAWVRGKVSAMLANDGGASDRTRAHAAEEARRHFLLAAACARPPMVGAQLLCVGGVIASGKSTLAEALSRRLSWPVVDTDRTRHQMTLADPSRTGGAWRGAYSPDATVKVYAEALRRASVVLASRRSVIVEASFRSTDSRRAARRLAQDLGVGFAFVECQAPVDTCRKRLATRAPGPSEASAAIFDDFIASYEPVREISGSEHVVVDTTGSIDMAVDALAQRLLA